MVEHLYLFGGLLVWPPGARREKTMQCKRENTAPLQTPLSIVK
jgi:hypothetical protein